MFNRKLTHVFLLFLFISFVNDANLFADSDSIKGFKHPYQEYQAVLSYQLPKKHPLRESLKTVFTNPNIFKSDEVFRKAGFRVKNGHRGLMVGAHPDIPGYLFKKFHDGKSQKEQLENFIKRLKGAEVLRKYVKEHKLKHIVIPKKWIYQLPKAFSKKYHCTSYILVVEDMDIYDGNDSDGIAQQLYYNMDREVLTELCMVLHDVGGCDAYPRNQPFTRSGKIAFIDTEHVGELKRHFFKHTVPALNPELQIYAKALWRKLEEKEIEAEH